MSGDDDSTTSSPFDLGVLDSDIDLANLSATQQSQKKQTQHTPTIPSSPTAPQNNNNNNKQCPGANAVDSDDDDHESNDDSEAEEDGRRPNVNTNDDENEAEEFCPVCGSLVPASALGRHLKESHKSPQSGSSAAAAKSAAPTLPAAGIDDRGADSTAVAIALDTSDSIGMGSSVDSSGITSVVSDGRKRGSSGKVKLVGKSKAIQCDDGVQVTTNHADNEGSGAEQPQLDAQPGADSVSSSDQVILASSPKKTPRVIERIELHDTESEPPLLLKAPAAPLGADVLNDSTGEPKSRQKSKESKKSKTNGKEHKHSHKSSSKDTSKKKSSKGKTKTDSKKSDKKKKESTSKGKANKKKSDKDKKHSKTKDKDKKHSKSKDIKKKAAKPTEKSEKDTTASTGTDTPEIEVNVLAGTKRTPVDPITGPKPTKTRKISSITSGDSSTLSVPSGIHTSSTKSSCTTVSSTSVSSPLFSTPLHSGSVSSGAHKHFPSPSMIGKDLLLQSRGASNSTVPANSPPLFHTPSLTHGLRKQTTESSTAKNSSAKSTPALMKFVSDFTRNELQRCCTSSVSNNPINLFGGSNKQPCQW
ncbi:hypothetical protein Pelo_6255 [Pelomyxa schiedti]|nr:hypothetical protein Pelo_6255 [Pelomyxa schiedti]